MLEAASLVDLVDLTAFLEHLPSPILQYLLVPLVTCLLRDKFDLKIYVSIRKVSTHLVSYQIVLFVFFELYLLLLLYFYVSNFTATAALLVIFFAYITLTQGPLGVLKLKEMKIKL